MIVPKTDQPWRSLIIEAFITETTSEISSSCVQLLVFIHTQQQAEVERGEPPVSGTDILAGAGGGRLTDFIKSTVSIHSVLTERIDQLRPSQQLTLKVSSPSPPPHTHTPLSPLLVSQGFCQSEESSVVARGSNPPPTFPTTPAHLKGYQCEPWVSSCFGDCILNGPSQPAVILVATPPPFPSCTMFGTLKVF